MSRVYFHTYFNHTRIASHRSLSEFVPKIKELQAIARKKHIDYALIRVYYPTGSRRPIKTVHACLYYDKHGQEHNFLKDGEMHPQFRGEI